MPRIKSRPALLRLRLAVYTAGVLAPPLAQLTAKVARPYAAAVARLMDPANWRRT